MEEHENRKQDTSTYRESNRPIATWNKLNTAAKQNSSSSTHRVGGWLFRPWAQRLNADSRSRRRGSPWVPQAIAKQASPNAWNEAWVTLANPLVPCAACLALNLAFSSAGVFPTPPCRESKKRGAHSTQESLGQERQSWVRTLSTLRDRPSINLAALRAPLALFSEANWAISMRISTRVVHDP